MQQAIPRLRNLGCALRSVTPTADTLAHAAVALSYVAASLVSSVTNGAFTTSVSCRQVASQAESDQRCAKAGRRSDSGWV